MCGAVHVSAVCGECLSERGGVAAAASAASTLFWFSVPFRVRVYRETLARRTRVRQASVVVVSRGVVRRHCCDVPARVCVCKFSHERVAVDPAARHRWPPPSSSTTPPLPPPHQTLIVLSVRSRESLRERKALTPCVPPRARARACVSSKHRGVFGTTPQSRACRSRESRRCRWPLDMPGRALSTNVPSCRVRAFLANRELGVVVRIHSYRDTHTHACTLTQTHTRSFARRELTFACECACVCVSAGQ